MGPFRFFDEKDLRFVSEDAFRKNLASQLAMSPRTLESLRGCGVKSSDLRRLEFFFYTDAETKAAALASALAAIGYSAEYGLPQGDDDRYLVTGWTSPVRMDKEEVLTWTKAMCEAGYEQDCDFDGWGTNAE